MVLGVERDIEIAAADRLGQKFVFALGVDDDDFGVEHERAQNFELGRVGFARARLGKDDRVVVFETRSDQRARARRCGG